MKSQPKESHNCFINGSFDIDLEDLKAIDSSILREFQSKFGVNEDDVEFEAILESTKGADDLVFPTIQSLENLPRIGADHSELKLKYNSRKSWRPSISVSFKVSADVLTGWCVYISANSESNSVAVVGSLEKMLREYRSREFTILRQICSNPLYSFVVFFIYVAGLSIIFPWVERFSEITKDIKEARDFIIGAVIVFNYFCFFYFSKFLLRSTELRLGGEQKRAEERRKKRQLIGFSLVVVPIVNPLLKLIDEFAR